MRRRAVLGSAFVLLLMAFVSADAFSQVAAVDSADLEKRTSAVAAQLRCPVCQGLSIQDSPSELAQQMRGVVRDQLGAGKTPDEVKRYFTDKYGEWILLEPKAEGFNILVYLLPVAAVIGGIAVIAMAVKRWSSPAPADPS
ncbi:MAG: cytochrome c-type biogenesis protein [Gemmatimonadota bacterium]